LSVYIHLADYYLLINSHEFAQKYYDDAIFLAKDDEIYSNLIYKLHYTWGFHELSQYRETEAIKHFELAYTHCFNYGDKLIIINRLMICYSILKKDITEFLLNGNEYINKTNELEKTMYNYFVLKNENKSNYREYAIEKIIPILKNMKKNKVILLFFYENLYQ